MRTKSEHRFLVSLCLAFFLAISFLGIALYLEVRAGVVGKRNFRDSLTASSYITDTKQKVSDKLKELLEEHDLDPLIAEQVITYDMVYMDISNYVDEVYASKDAYVDTTTMEELLEDQIYEYFNLEDSAVTDQVELAVTELVQSAKTYYKTYVTTEFAKSYYEFSQQIYSKAKKLYLVCVGIALLCIFLLCSLYHYKYHAIDYMIYSALTAMSVNGLATQCLLNTDFVDQLGVEPDYYMSLIKAVVAHLKKEGVVVTLILGVMGLILFVLKEVLKLQKR